jgi:hypothetical protein
MLKAYKESIIENHKKNRSADSGQSGGWGAKHNILDPSLKVTHVPCNCI